MTITEPIVTLSPQTLRRRAICKAMASFYDGHRKPATLREIAELAEIPRETVAADLSRLLAAGHVRRVGAGARCYIATGWPL